MESIDLNKLRDPIKMKWRVQSVKYGRAVCVPYIDARDAQKALDDVVGPSNWQSRHKEEKGRLFCEVGIKVDGEWIWKSDVGSESNIEKEKGESSDSFKRACVMWGVGRFLYDIDPIVLMATKVGDKPKEYPVTQLFVPRVALKSSAKPIYNGNVLSDFINENHEAMVNHLKKAS